MAKLIDKLYLKATHFGLYFRQHMRPIANIINSFTLAYSGLIVNPSCTILINKNAKLEIATRLFLKERVKVVIEHGGKLVCHGDFVIHPDTTIIIKENAILELGANGFILNSAWIEVPHNGRMVIGDYTTVQLRCMLHGNVEIGDNTLLSPEVYISSGSHTFDMDPSMTIREQDNCFKSDSAVKIGSNSWLGIRVYVKPGLNLSEGTIIGANSVVTKSTDQYSIYAGIPARKIRSYR